MFKAMLNDIVSLHKSDGRIFENIRANVQPKKIFVHDASIPIEEGDVILRALPNGLTERYLVIDRGFHQAFHGIEAHYQITVQKESAIKHGAPTSTVYNIGGINSRVNINSLDNSINSISINKSEIFTEMCHVAEQSHLESAEKEKLLHCISGMSKASGSSDFPHRYKEFVATAADHLSLLTPFIPVLTQMLG